MCRKIPDEETIRQMYAESGIPCNIINHMKAVADYQDMLIDELEQAGTIFDRELLRAAALLHDIKRLEKNHAAAGSKYVEEAGYPEVAALIEGHHSPMNSSSETEGLSAADILYYADKRLKGSSIVSVIDRFAASEKKCTTEAAIKKHDALLARAIAIEDKINSIVSKKNHRN